MNIVFIIFQGIGVGAALGVRPFLPMVLVGALAAGDVEINFTGTDYSFLESAPFLLAMAALAVILLVAERRVRQDRLERGPGGIMLGVSSLALAALAFAGALSDHHHVAWPGWIGGVIAATIAILAVRPLFRRVRGRLEGDVAAWLPAYAEVVAIVIAGLSVIAPPVGLIAVALLVWLLIAGRGREEQKYAGLRILR